MAERAYKVTRQNAPPPRCMGPGFEGYYLDTGERFYREYPGRSTMARVDSASGLFGSANYAAIRPERVDAGPLSPIAVGSAGRRAEVSSAARRSVPETVGHQYHPEVLAGFATLFGVEMTTFSGKRIRFAPNCEVVFARNLAVVMNHDREREIATTADGSAKVGTDGRGVYAVFTPRNSVRLDNLVGDLVGRVRRGVLGMSLEYQAADYEKRGYVLHVESAIVNEITLTDRPACRGTRCIVVRKHAGRELALALREDAPFHKH